MSTIKSLANLSLTIVSSIVMILLAVVYFMVVVWIIKVGAGWAGFTDISGNSVVMTAGIITAAIVVGSALQK